MKRLIIRVEEMDEFSITGDQYELDLKSFDLLVDQSAAVMDVITMLRASVEEHRLTKD